MNRKGFTMVELLVAMAIMGLLMIMAFPTMRAVQTNNQKKKYESYGESVISSTKLYVDSYSEDLFDPSIKNQFRIIYLSEIQKKGLIKDIGISDSSCINGESNVTVVKYNNDYAYCLHLKCFNKNGSNNVVYETENTKGNCANFTKVNVTYKYGSNEKTFEVISGEDYYRVLNNSTLGFNYSSNKDVFLKWKDNKNNEYDPGDIIGYPIPETGLTLTAKTRKFKYRLRYGSSLAGTTGAVDEHDCTYGQECKLKDNKFEKDYYQFTNWTYNSKNYNEKEDVKDKIGKTITVDNQLINISSVFRKNKLSIVRYSEGGVLTPSDSQDCPKTAKCPKDKCDWHNGGDSEYCTGKAEGKIYIGEKVFFDGTNFSAYGLKDYCNEGSLYSTRTGYNCTGNWLIGSNTSSVKIHENKLYSNNLDFVKDCKGNYDKLLKKGDITINTYAEWTPKTIKVTYDCDGGKGGGSENFTYDKTGQKFGKKCTKDGYKQTGWRFKDDTKKRYEMDNGISNAWIDKYSSSITLYATWDKNSYKLKFDKNGGTGTCNDITKNYNETWGTLCSTTKLGYTFDGWYTKENGGGSKITSSSKATSDLTVHANWILKTKVEYTENLYIYYVSGENTSKKNCKRNNGKHLKDGAPYKNAPYRSFYFKTYSCTCKLNEAHINVGTQDVDPPERSKHEDGDITIFYNNTVDGEKSCKETDGHYLNQNVASVCKDSEFVYDEGPHEKNFHGYKWYNNNPGTAGEHQFTPGWFHNKTDHDVRYKVGKNLPNNASERKKACNHICNLYYK